MPRRDGVYGNGDSSFFLLPVHYGSAQLGSWGPLLGNLLQHSNPRTVTPLDEVKKSSLCVQVYGWWRDYLESPCASWEWGGPSHSWMMMEVCDKSQIPLINHQNHCPCHSWKGHLSSDLGMENSRRVENILILFEFAVIGVHLTEGHPSILLMVWV